MKYVKVSHFFKTSELHINTDPSVLVNVLFGTQALVEEGSQTRWG